MRQESVYKLITLGTWLTGLVALYRHDFTVLSFVIVVGMPLAVHSGMKLFEVQERLIR